MDFNPYRFEWKNRAELLYKRDPVLCEMTYPREYDQLSEIQAAIYEDDDIDGYEED